MSRTNLAQIDAGRFVWLVFHPPRLWFEILGLDLDNPRLEIPVRDGAQERGPLQDSSFSERTSREPSGGFQAFSSGSPGDWLRRRESRPTS